MFQELNFVHVAETVVKRGQQLRFLRLFIILAIV